MKPKTCVVGFDCSRAPVHERVDSTPSDSDYHVACGSDLRSVVQARVILGSSEDEGKRAARSSCTRCAPPRLCKQGQYQIDTRTGASKPPGEINSKALVAPVLLPCSDCRVPVGGLLGGEHSK